MSQYLYKRLRAGSHGGIDVVGFKTLTSGVLNGQTVKCFIDNFADEQAAQAAHPDAEGYTNKWIDPAPSLAHLPGEDDPVPGGMYPDDIGGA